jgi:hypothetical protein
MTDLIALADRCEAAEGADRDLDEAIALALGWSSVPNPTFAGGLVGRWLLPDGSMTGQIDALPKFTASLDAAMTLVPEGQASAVGTMAFRNDPRKPWACIWSEQGEPLWRADAATPALALCAAALRARASMETNHEGR